MQCVRNVCIAWKVDLVKMLSLVRLSQKLLICCAEFYQGLVMLRRMYTPTFSLCGQSLVLAANVKLVMPTRHKFGPPTVQLLRYGTTAVPGEAHVQKVWRAIYYGFAKLGAIDDSRNRSGWAGSGQRSLRKIEVVVSRPRCCRSVPEAVKCAGSRVLLKCRVSRFSQCDITVLCMYIC